MDATVKAPGSCGELVQGSIGGKNFLITCPIDLYTEVSVKLVGSEISAGDKTIQAVKKTWQVLGFDQHDFTVTVKSSLPRGKGMASSSADISAACLAAAIAAGKNIDPDQITDIALGIEPTDGIFYPGIVMIDHVHGLTRQPLGFPPPIKIAIFDVGGEVDTLQFNRRSDLALLNDAKEHEVSQAVELVKQGIATRDPKLIGRGATLSALANQKILYKACLPVVADLAPRFGAVGINTAHSGTVIGILFDAVSANNIEQCIAAVLNACPEVSYIQTANLIAGGLQVVGGTEQ